ncbi:MAG: VacB/RNase II family 3'-5' exoribonuclease [Kofleriaceae bacterium]
MKGSLQRQDVLDALARQVTPGIKLTALADELGLRKHELAGLRTLLLQLVEDGTLHVLPGGAFAQAPRGRGADPHGKPPAPARERPPRATSAREPGRKAVTLRAERRAVKLTPRGGAAPRGASPPPARLARPTSDPGAWAAPEMTPEPPARARPSSTSAPAGRAPEPVATPAAEAAMPRARRRRTLAGAPTSGLAAEPIAADPARTSRGWAAARPAPAARGEGVVGRITIHPAGYGFVATEDGQTVFVPAKYRGLSLDGDQVSLSTWTGVKGIEGRVDDVLARGRARLTGILRRAGAMRMYLEPDDPRIATNFGRVALDGVSLGKEGDAVVVEITRYPTAVDSALSGRVLKVLGDPEDPRTEIEKILAVASIPLEFPEATLAQAKATPQALGPADFADRIDLRSRRFCTIDPETARDFDDALCVEDGPHGGPRVWVAVADVGHYVRWGDALDREAVIRGVSVYLPDRVISMLPIELSAGICSLNPDVDRCAMVVRLDFDRDGAVVEAGLAAAVIRSHARLDYPGVAAALGGDFRGRREQYREWEAELRRLSELATQLRSRRRQRGALELEVGEPKVVLDSDDPRLVRDVVRAKGDPAVKGAYSLVEEFMIAANEAVGRYFRQRGVTSVWRVHTPPVLDRRATLVQLLGAYGIAADADEIASPLGMKRVLDEVAAHPAARALSFLVLRTLTQAVWDTVPVGHFGLASGDYLHFTSPIRRYPDLIVHRLLKHYLHKEGQASGGGYHDPPPTSEELAGLASASSAHERRAMEAEREAVSMYRAYLMREQIGEQYRGVVSAVTSFGAFVEIDQPFVEGLLRIDSLGDEPFFFDEVHLRLTGQLTGTTLALGDEVTVEIRDVSVLRRRIDLGLVAAATGHAAVPSGRGKVRRAGRAGATPTPTPTPVGPIGLAAQRRAGREVAKAAAAGKGGKPLRLGVSHRSGVGDADAEGRGGKPSGRARAGKGRAGASKAGKPNKRRR